MPVLHLCNLSMGKSFLHNQKHMNLTKQTFTNTKNILVLGFAQWLELMHRFEEYLFKRRLIEYSPDRETLTGRVSFY